jgi:hypothetical protein
MDALFETGGIILGGPFADRTGALVILTADNAAQVYEMYRRDPWTERDVLVMADVKEWTIFLDGRRRPLHVGCRGGDWQAGEAQPDRPQNRAARDGLVGIRYRRQHCRGPATGSRILCCRGRK